MCKGAAAIGGSSGVKYAPCYVQETLCNEDTVCRITVTVNCIAI